MTNTMSDLAPRRPEGVGRQAETNGPRPLTDEELAIARSGDATRGAAPDHGPVPDDNPVPGPPAPPVAGGRPMLHLPGTPGAADDSVDGFTTAAVLALYATGAPPAGWIHLDGVGWRRLANDGGTLGEVAAAARTAGTPVMAKLDADDVVTELYLW
jgi:hypothetical protein